MTTSQEITIGDLRHLVAIKAPTRTGDGGGGAAVTWTLVAEAWAAIRPRKGAEVVDADRQWGSVSHEIWLRARPGITAAMRVELGARRFDIRAVLEVGDRRRWLRLLCLELTP
jgi:SPP1 family predicted phage head-tail adaptor